jgi:hypothetical protein
MSLQYIDRSRFMLFDDFIYLYFFSFYYFIWTEKKKTKDLYKEQKDTGILKILNFKFAY